MTTHGDEEDHSVSGTLTEGAEAGTLLLLHGKMLFLTDSAKGNPLGGLYIPGRGGYLNLDKESCVRFFFLFYGFS